MNREVFESAFVEIWKGANFFEGIKGSWMNAIHELIGIIHVLSKAGPMYEDLYHDAHFLMGIAAERNDRMENS